MLQAIDDHGIRTALAARPDPQGEAALVLVESLLHGLLARSALSLREAIDIVETAANVQAEVDDSRASGTADGCSTASLLTAIKESLAIDLLAENHGG